MAKQETEATTSKDAESIGLPFGTKQRQLPWHIESVCYSFISLQDLATLLLSSRRTRALVSRFLADARTVYISDDEFVSPTDRVQGIRLPFKHCTRLAELRPDSAFDRDWIAHGKRFWLACMMKRFKRTLTYIDETFLDKVSLPQLLECRKLTTFVLPRGRQGNHLFDSSPNAKPDHISPEKFTERFSPDTLPDLHTLSLAAQDGLRIALSPGKFLTSDNIAAILAKGKSPFCYPG